MRRTNRCLLAVALALLTLPVVTAACGDDSDDSEQDAAASSADPVSIEDVDGTSVLADSGGQTLYTADVERDGILCTKGCTSFWAPTVASSGEAESAAADLDLELGVVERPDGDRQLTLDGLPLYSFAEEGPGQLEGDGFVDDFEGTTFEWQAATAGEPGTSSAPASPVGGY